MKIFSIEGNIGSGKSTIIKYLKENVNCIDDKKIIYLDEPVDEWGKIKDSSGVTILEKYYSDSTKYAFSFQMMAFITRIKQIKESLNDDAIIIMERCIYTDKQIFAKMLYDSGTIDDIEYSVYLLWFEYFVNEIKIDGYIYIKIQPGVCLERIKSRNRQGEHSIQLEYLQNIEKYHDNWLYADAKNTLFINDIDFDIIIKDILNFVKIN